MWAVCAKPRLGFSVFLLELPAKVPPLIRAHVSPLLPHLLSPLGWQRSKPAPRVADGVPLLRRQSTESFEPFAQPRLLIRVHLFPLLEPLARLGTFIGVHVRPLASPIQQSLLSIGRHLVPLSAEPLQDTLLLLVQLPPGSRLNLFLRESRPAKGQDEDECSYPVHGFTSPLVPLGPLGARGCAVSASFALPSRSSSRLRPRFWEPASS